MIQSIHLEDRIKTKTYNESGRGRKQCPKCNSYIGIRTRVCNCTHTFSKDDKPINKLSPHQEDLIKYCAVLGKTKMDTVVYTPTQMPPIRLSLLTRDGVFDWADEVIEYGKNSFKIFTIEALCYMMGHEVGYDCEEYRMCKKWLYEWKDSLI